MRTASVPAASVEKLFPAALERADCLGLLLVPPIHVLLCQYHAVLITVALYYNLRSRIVTSALHLLPRIAFVILGLLQFCVNFRIVFSSTMSNAVVSLGPSSTCVSVLGLWQAIESSSLFFGRAL